MMRPTILAVALLAALTIAPAQAQEQFDACLTLRGLQRQTCYAAAARGRTAEQATDADQAFSMVCVMDKSVGFNWENGDWMSGNFRQYSLLLKKKDKLLAPILKQATHQTSKLRLRPLDKAVTNAYFRHLRGTLE